MMHTFRLVWLALRQPDSKGTLDDIRAFSPDTFKGVSLMAWQGRHGQVYSKLSSDPIIWTFSFE